MPTTRPKRLQLFTNRMIAMALVLSLFGVIGYGLWPANQTAQSATQSVAARDNSAVILMYHHFGKDSVPSTNIRLAQFDAQLDYLAANDFHIWSLSRLVIAFQNQVPIPDKTVVFTVDDAWISVYEHAIPRFKARGWPVTIFVNSDAIDKGYRSNMTWAQMREVQGDGIEFANHSRSHDRLIRRVGESHQAWQKRVLDEIQQGQQRLQDELGANTNHAKLFSYPFGDYSTELADWVRELGYVGIAQNSGAVNRHSDLRALMRFPMSEAYADLDSFKQKVYAVAMPLLHVEPFDPVVTDNPPHLTLTFTQPPGPQLQCYSPQGERLQQRWLNDTTVEIRSETPLAAPRSRYACTQPTADGRWRWYSHSWVLQ